jgi:uncharacterized membrane protein YphA (DoxX/SURF4 family)
LGVDPLNIAIWVAQALLAVAFLASGLMKVARPRTELRAQMPYVEDFSDGQVKAIGLVEVLGAIGLILPSAFKVVPILTPVAGVGLVLTMLGAIATHVRRGEVGPRLAVNVILLLLALAVAWARFGPYSI